MKWTAEQYRDHVAKKLPETKPGKYRNQKTEYRGEKYDSKKEAEYARKLDAKFLAGEILTYFRQVRMPIRVNGVKICTYVCDFLIIHNDETKEYVDVKGFRTKEYILKAKLVEACFGVKINEV